MMECTCYKPKINGLCDVCREWYQGPLFKQAAELIKKYPQEVKELINGRA